MTPCRRAPITQVRRRISRLVSGPINNSEAQSVESTRTPVSKSMGRDTPGGRPNFPTPGPPAPAKNDAPACPPLPEHAHSACEPHCEWIEAQVRVGRNATAIYQELVDRFGC